MDEEDIIKQIDNLTTNQVKIWEAIFNLNEQIAELKNKVKLRGKGK